MDNAFLGMKCGSLSPAVEVSLKESNSFSVWVLAMVRTENHGEDSGFPDPARRTAGICSDHSLASEFPPVSVSLLLALDQGAAKGRKSRARGPAVAVTAKGRCGVISAHSCRGPAASQGGAPGGGPAQLGSMTC